MQVLRSYYACVLLLQMTSLEKNSTGQIHTYANLNFRVHGIDGLRVVDASVFPHQITGNTHVTVIAIAEKAADLIKNAA